MSEVRFQYKPNVILFILVALLFSACTAVLGNIAITNDRGLVLNRILEFSTGGATSFYWVLTVCAAVFVVIAIVGFISGLSTKKEIVLTESSISAPKSGISKKVVTLKYSEISDVSMQAIQNQKFLNILHQGGKLTIPQSMLPRQNDFDKLVNLIASKVNG